MSDARVPLVKYKVDEVGDEYEDSDGPYYLAADVDPLLEEAIRVAELLMESAKRRTAPQYLYLDEDYKMAYALLARLRA